MGVPATATFTVPEAGEASVALHLKEADRLLTLKVRDQRGNPPPSRCRFRLWRDADALSDVRIVEGPLYAQPVRLPALPPGTYNLIVYGWGHRQLATVEVYETHEQALEVSLRAFAAEGTANLRGNIRRLNGGPPVRNCVVYLAKAEGSEACATVTSMSGTVGSYRFDGLPAGKYTLRIRASLLHAPGHAEVVQEVELHDERDVYLDLSLPGR
jgi:hypothetical protein